MTTIFITISGLLALLPGTVHAAFSDIYSARGMESVMPLCNVLPCNWVGLGSAGLSMYVFSKIILTLEIGIIAAAIVCLFIAAAQMVFSSAEESSVKDSKTSYIYIITGLAIVGMSHLFVNAFSPGTFAPPGSGLAGGAGANLVNTAAIGTGVGNVISYIKLIIALSLLVNIVLQSFRLISSQGEDEQTKKAKTRLIGGFIGTGIIMLANAIVIAVSPATFGGPALLVMEIAGIANYMLMILGFLAVMTIFIAGVLLVVSFDESLKDKARSMIKTSIIALIVVLMSFALVQAFILL